MSELTWGTTIRIRGEAPAAMRPKSVADIVGIRQVETSETAVQFDVAIGTTLFLVEFGDGVAVEVPEGWVEPLQGAERARGR